MVAAKIDESDSIERLFCPFCHGDGVSFHPTYGSEKKCTVCKGKGVVAKDKLKKLDIL
jgi:DnaJ-class molecular chaperone